MNLVHITKSKVSFLPWLILIMISLPPFSLSDPRTSLAGFFCGSNTTNSTNSFVTNFVRAMEETSGLVAYRKWGYFSNQSGQTPIYALTQCYQDLSKKDCTLCYAEARTIIPQCYPMDAGRLYLDGCFMRYDSYDFARESVDRTTDTSVCSNKTGLGNVDAGASFRKDAEELIDNVTSNAVSNEGYAVEGWMGVYGLAQCWQSLNRKECEECLTKASKEVKSCLPRNEGRRLNAGCYLRYSTQKFYNGPPQHSANTEADSSISLPLKLMIAALVVIAIIILSIIVFRYRTRRCFLLLCNWNKHRGKDDQNIEAFMKHWDSVAIKQYNYSEIKKITNSFGEKLGQGGYGSVYKGKLLDGRQVAVKVLSETKGDGQDFINEVSSISRTSHVNVVTLLGFCYNRKRALVYEFMPNGSLDKFIDRNELQSSTNILEWKRLYQIAVGIAQGLEYLHRGCKTRIVHFDIKPHNILLDEDFCPKISDFGLAKLSEKKESILSSLTTRGTVGYIAPEVFSRHFGGASHKSDVYSYGMMVLEMVGVRKNAVEVQRSSDVYFPQWIYEHLELGKDLNILAVTGEEDEEISRKMMLVGLWCIQTNPSDRPSISKVVEMLEGSLQSLQIPPKPFLYSPKGLPQHPSASFSVGTNTSESTHIHVSVEN